MKPKETVTYTLAKETETDKLFIVLIQQDMDDEPTGFMAFKQQMGSMRTEPVKAKTIFDAAHIAAEQIAPRLRHGEEIVAIKKDSDNLYG